MKCDGSGIPHALRIDDRWAIEMTSFGTNVDWAAGATINKLQRFLTQMDTPIRTPTPVLTMIYVSKCSVRCTVLDGVVSDVTAR